MVSARLRYGCPLRCLNPVGVLVFRFNERLSQWIVSALVVEDVPDQIAPFHLAEREIISRMTSSSCNSSSARARFATGSGKTRRIVLGLPERKIERAIQVFKFTLSLHYKTRLGLLRHFVRF